MFWADKAASEIIKSGRYKPYWVDDMKTPSGRVHVGALMGVVIHDLIYNALKDKGVDASYTYVFENHDPMDDIPAYLSRNRFEKYLGMPLFAIPSPEAGFKNYAEFYALDFQKTFNTIGSYPKILWTKDLYTSGKMNDGIKKVLDNAEEIRKIYKEMYKREIPSDWYPFQVYCENCGKVSTTKVYKWDNELVFYRCLKDAVKWTRGCGYEGSTSPFSDERGMKGKMPWKVEWAVKWRAIGVTIEGAGKDHMSAGGSHDLASEVARRVLGYPVPYPIAYEWILVGGRKMSSSRGIGTAASEMLEILPPELIRFLIVKMDIRKQTNFDPGESETIPRLFDEYQEFAFSDNADQKRIFELSKLGKPKEIPSVRFSTLVQWVQMPNMESEIKKTGAEEWAKYARVWLERFAPEDQKFTVQEDLPDSVRKLSSEQKKLLERISKELDKKWEGENLQTRIYDIGKELGLNGAKTFEVIYLSLLGKSHGPKAAWLILSLDKKFVQKRFQDASK